MSTTIQETIDRLHELDRTASPAPWRAVFDTQIYSGREEVFEVDTTSDEICEWFECSDECGCASYARKPDIDLLVAARNSLPVLLAEIDRLKAENKSLEEVWEDGYKTAAHTYYEGQSEPDDFTQDARIHSPYKENKK